MINMKSKVKIGIIVLLLLIILISLTSFLFLGKQAYADSFSYANINDETIKYLDKYSNRTNESQNKPQITVLTHGLGQGATSWAKNGTLDFEITESDIVGQIIVPSREK